MTDSYKKPESVWHIGLKPEQTHQSGSCWLILTDSMILRSLLSSLTRLGIYVIADFGFAVLLDFQPLSTSSLWVHSVGVRDERRKQAIHPAVILSNTSRGRKWEDRRYSDCRSSVCLRTWRKSFEEGENGNNYTRVWVFSRLQPTHEWGRETPPTCLKASIIKRKYCQYLKYWLKQRVRV